MSNERVKNKYIYIDEILTTWFLNIFLSNNSIILTFSLVQILVG